MCFLSYEREECDLTASSSGTDRIVLLFLIVRTGNGSLATGINVPMKEILWSSIICFHSKRKENENKR